MPSGGFATDFSYSYFVKLIRAARERFEPCRFSELPEALENEIPGFFSCAMTWMFH